MAPPVLATRPVGARVRHRMRVCGVVQGVGFRPFVYRLATGLDLGGHVGNDPDGVFVEVEGDAAAVGTFERLLVSDRPPLARIVAVSVTAVRDTGETDFRIVDSRSATRSRTFVAPDVAVCEDCLRELADPADRRHRYPFVNCTNCGPRFTITRRLPYDRPNTTMAAFELCGPCRAEYEDQGDRRFQAQPVACPACGPRLWFEGRDGPVDGTDAALAEAQATLAEGDVLAVKGLGGYHLACDACSEPAVAGLRERKQRGDKPLAVMVPDLAAARRVGYVGEDEAALLTGPQRPIVLLRRRPGSAPTRLVAPGNPFVGVMLPYTPVHHLLFEPVPGSGAPVPQVLVMTSGNLSDEPICYEDADAHKRLEHLVDAWLTHDRPIHVPCDDSVVRVVDGELLPVRRSRGYAPLPVGLPFETVGSVAAGGELKNTLCVASGTSAWMSQHIGDMGSLETLGAFERSADQLTGMYGVDPERVIADAHPGYQTRRWADTRAGEPVLVQHHHAHIAAVMAERGVPPGRRVIGFAFDGTGYGTDGAIWGGEVLVADYDGFERAAHLRYVPLPGGDATIRKPYRAALAHLWAAGIAWVPGMAPLEVAGPREAAVLERQLERGLQCVPTSSMGRLFDAVSSLLDVRHVASYEAQAAVELETIASAYVDTPREYRFPDTGTEIDPGPVLAAIVEDLRAGRPLGAVAAGFHAAVARLVVSTARRLRRETGVDRVALSGGVFQNALLLRLTRTMLADGGLRVLTHRVVPPNDGGLALGQVAVAGRTAAPDPGAGWR